ncbi:uncharacterized protein LOC120625428 isoform X2 [Pararge aegeria]|uniref:uncharacterized protein LOC120625428 isoform X2 n=1 Tax=Pararge aegeria TaxID=116150 RepID=UPI0019D17088|nr:uncharacterized protein LOC120625428 isoform X2 [Pararge aegeria]
MAVLKLVLCLSFVHMVFAKGSEAQSECTPEYMRVTIPMDGDRKLTYLDQLKDYTPCEPTMEGNLATFMLDLQDYPKCAVTRVLNKITGKRTYYHKIVIEDGAGGREIVTVRCVVTGKMRALSRRAVEEFPLNFNEPDTLDITRYMEGRAPEPILGALVKQNGKQVSGEISVTPGTPLSMEIFLDNSSAPVYGLLVGYMHVTDTGKQQETIIFNGCSVDPYLFDNFLTTDGKNLTAKFRAFKFPDTTYVQFKGTVTVCLNKCQGVECSNGVTAYGRKRRAITSGAEANKVFEVSLTTIIKVDWADGNREEEVLTLLKNLKYANQLLGDKDGTPATVSEQTQDSRPIVNREELTWYSNNSHIQTYSCMLLLVTLFLVSRK